MGQRGSRGSAGPQGEPGASASVGTLTTTELAEFFRSFIDLGDIPLEWQALTWATTALVAPTYCLGPEYDLLPGLADMYESMTYVRPSINEMRLYLDAACVS